MELIFPYKGYHKGFGAEKQPQHTTVWIQNARVFDTLDNRWRGGQRGGLAKAFAQQIGGAALPIVWVGYVTEAD